MTEKRALNPREENVKALLKMNDEGQLARPSAYAQEAIAWALYRIADSMQGDIAVASAGKSK